MFPLNHLRAEHPLRMNNFCLFLVLCHPQPTTGDWPEAGTHIPHIQSEYILCTIPGIVQISYMFAKENEIGSTYKHRAKGQAPLGHPYLMLVNSYEKS